VRSITIDGEAVWCGKDGKSDFDRLHSGVHDAAVFLYAFDLIELNGEDLRPMPLEQRKGKLEKLLARSDGIRCVACHAPNRRKWRRTRQEAVRIGAE
jgi:ATP-dependent DNA ligase